MTDSSPKELIVELEHAGNPLHGTLTLPHPSTLTDTALDKHAAVAAILLLPDSGPMDRNQNSLQAQLNIHNHIAKHLAEHGIASVRYDKRGCGLSKGNFDAAGHSDLVADAQAWLEYLHQRSTVAGCPVYIIGHGEGSLIASQLSGASNEVKGQVLLMPFVENFENIIRRQAENALREIADMEGFKGKLFRFFLKISGDQMAKQKKLVAKIRKSRKDTFKIRKQVINAKWIREMVTLDAASIYSKVSLPTLLIGGKKDLQCQPEDVGKIAALLTGDVEYHVFEDLTHILRPDKGKPAVQKYLTLALQDLDSRVLDTLTQWLLDQCMSGSGPAFSRQDSS